MKKVLIITYYWPPSGGGGVQRWLKFAKYLREFGWEPIIYTPENPEMPAVDESLLQEIPEGIEVIKHPIWEPFTLYKRFTGQKKDKRINTGFLSENEKPKFAEDLAVWIRGNFFIPDARKFWIRPSIKFLRKYLKNNPVDAIVSTGPPHSMHIIAMGLKKSLNIPWVADFRDPWTNIDFYPKLKLSKWADNKHKRLEKKVLKSANEVVTVSWNWAKDFQSIVQREVKVITNGFDQDNFKDTAGIKLDKQFTLVHIGAMNADRNPESLWKALGELVESVPGFGDELEIKLIGSNDISVQRSLESNGLISNVKFVKYLSHKDVVKVIRSAQVLLLPLNNTPNVLGIIPGKLYEYLAAKRPIVCIGPANGDSAKIIAETGSGNTFGFDDVDALKDGLLEMYRKFRSRILELEHGKVDQYERRNLTKRMGQVLNSCIVLPQVSG